MYFNNPDIIKSDTDIILGSVSVDNDEQINFLNLINRCENNYALIINDYVNELVSDKIDREQALRMTAGKIYGILDMYEKLMPESEQHLAELMMQSKNYDMWQSDIMNRYSNTHSGKTTARTPIQATSESGESQERIEELVSDINLDTILETLAMYMDIGKPTTDSYGAPKEIKK